jgi:hypothetical protein
MRFLFNDAIAWPTYIGIIGIVVVMYGHIVPAWQPPQAGDRIGYRICQIVFGSFFKYFWDNAFISLLCTTHKQCIFKSILHNSIAMTS